MEILFLAQTIIFIIIIFGIFNAIFSKTYLGCRINRAITVALNIGNIKKEGDEYRIVNENVAIYYNYNTDILVIHDLKENNRYEMEVRGSESRNSKNSIFDYLAAFFEQNTNFQQVDNLLKLYTGVTLTNNPSLPKAGTPKPPKINIAQTDINSASDDEIAQLPGVGIASAKKAVKYRDKQGGFKTKEEFFEVVKMKFHFIEMTQDYIVVGEYLPEKDIKLYTEGREVDF